MNKKKIANIPGKRKGMPSTNGSKNKPMIIQVRCTPPNNI